MNGRYLIFTVFFACGCAVFPKAPEALDATTVAFARVQCPAKHRVFFQRYDKLARQYIIDCEEFSGRLVAFEVSPGLFELNIGRWKGRTALRWTHNIFEVKAAGQAWYWGDIKIGIGGDVRIQDNPASRTEFARAQPKLTIVYGVTDE